MRVRRLTAAFAVPLALAAVCALAMWLRPVDLRTSLYDIVGSAAETVPAAVRDHSSRLVPVLVSSTNAAAAKAAADSLAVLLPTGECASVRYRFDGAALSETLELCRSRSPGLVSAGDERLLETPEGRTRIARAAIRRYYSSPVPPLFSPAEDPFCLADSFVKSLPVSFSRWMPSDGVLTAARAGRVYVLIVLELADAAAKDADRLIGFKSQLDAACRRIDSSSVEVVACGVPLHTAQTAGRCRTEVTRLTWFSLAFIALLTLFVFRSLAGLVLFAASMAVSALAGAAALMLFFPNIHIMTIVFGTTVLGMVVDYSFHWLLQPVESRRETVRNLLVSFATTEISLLPLFFSSLPVLRQSAAFLGVGLAAALLYVLVCYPEPTRRTLPSAEALRLPYSRVLLFLIAAVAVVGASRTAFVTDPTSIYRPAPDLAAAEKLFAELSGTADGRRGFAVTQGSDDLETLLGREAALAFPDSVPCLSRFLPSLSRRLKIAADVEKLYAEHAQRQAELLGLDRIVSPPPPQPWRWRDVPRSAAAFVAGHSLIVPSVLPPSGPLPDGVGFFQPKKMLGEILSDLAEETRLRLIAAIALMFVILGVFLRARALSAFLPSMLSLLGVAGYLGFAGENFTLFHILACFLLAGMAVDYTVFIHSDVRSALRPAVCALLTSIAGFGALTFVSFPVVNAFGTVLALGLPLAFFAAVATAPRKGKATEHGASPLGMEALFLVYRVFGLRVLHVGAACTGLALWAFSRDVRRASPSPRKVIAFTHSLADKLAVMAGGRRLPKVETDGTDDARAFLDDVAARRGVFVLSSHCGTVEALAALGECDATFHAWMEFERTSVFNAFYLRHARRGKVVIHPISSFGPDTVFTAGDALDSGDCLVMAGDRGFGRMRRVPFRSGEIELPEGAFRFARALEHPVYFVACVATGGCRYRAIVRRLPSSGVDQMACAYAAFLEEVTRAYPHQWFKWEGDPK